MLTGECIAQPSSEKFLLMVDGNQYKNPNLYSMQRVRDFGVLSLEWAPIGVLYVAEGVERF